MRTKWSLSFYSSVGSPSYFSPSVDKQFFTIVLQLAKSILFQTVLDASILDIIQLTRLTDPYLINVFSRSPEVGKGFLSVFFSCYCTNTLHINDCWGNSI